MDIVDRVTWVVEPDVFPETYSEFMNAIERPGHGLVTWKDEWWRNRRWPDLSDQAVVFHGSLGNAARIRDELLWRPGAFCDIARFRCSSWYPSAKEWLLHRNWLLSTVSDFVAGPASVVAPLGSPAAVFVRPDSPLKPFSGRVLDVEHITLRSLDHGFYYDDDRIEIIVAPVREITREWRFVVADRKVVAGSRYEAAHRRSLPDDLDGAAWSFARAVALEIEEPEPVFVLDVCESDGRYWLLELNPFSGADLYACDPDAIVEAVSKVARRFARTG